MLFGREQERLTLSALIDDACAGRGGALVLRGGVGAGKSALLAAAMSHARSSGAVVIDESMDKDDAQVTYAGLARLAHRLPPWVCAALLDAARGGTDDAARYRVALLLVQVLGTRPTVVIVDSAQWTDEESWRTLAVAARRLVRHPVAFLAAARDAPAVDTRLAFDLPELTVGPLPHGAANDLLVATRDSLPVRTRDRVLAQANGNPLAVIELSRRSVSAPARRLFHELVEPLPEATRLLLLVCALGEGRPLRDVLATATVVHGDPVGVAEIEPAVAAGLFELEDGFRPRLGHPLLAAALVQGAPAELRARVRRTLAQQAGVTIPRPRRPVDEPDPRLAWGRSWLPTEGAATPETFLALAGSHGLAADDPTLVQALAVDPIAHGGAVLGRLATLSRSLDHSPQDLVQLGYAAALITAFDHAATFLAAALPGLRAAGLRGLLAQALTTRAMVAVMLGDTRRGLSAAREAQAAAEQTQQPAFAAAAEIVLAHAEALQGNAASVQLLADAGEPGHRSVPALRCRARGVLALAEGRAGDAVDELLRLVGDEGSHSYLRLSAVGLLAEAAVLSGRQAEVVAVVERLEPLVRRAPLPLLVHGLRYARAVTAPDDVAEGLFRAALEAAELVGWAFERGRLELAYGSWLRRQRRLGEAHETLRSAAMVFEALGVRPWLARARRELPATGRPDGSTTALAELTVQQRRIARLVADGLTDQEIAERLFISRRTVTTHLSRIYARVAARSRADLARMMVGDT